MSLAVITCADGFKHVTAGPVRVTGMPGQVKIQEYDAGIWRTVYETPFTVEVVVNDV